MYALPRALPEYRDVKFSGEIVYNSRTQCVPQVGFEPRLCPRPRLIEPAESRLRSLLYAFPALRSAASATSREEDCSERIESVSQPCTPVTDDF